MASENVEKMLLELKKEPTLMLELSLALVRIEESAGLDLSSGEKQEFFSVLAEELSKEVLIVAWI